MGDKQGQAKSENSPSNSSKQSDSQGDAAGDRSGGGEKGGGQKAEKAGTGSEGSRTPSDEGGSIANQKGQGQPGRQAGDQAKADHPTGRSAKQPAENAPGRQGEQSSGQGAGKKQETQPGASQASKSKNDQSNGAEPGNQDSNNAGPRSAGNPTVGGRPGLTADASSPAAAKQPAADEANLDYARKQTDLALEHLREQTARDNSELLDELGWSREDAERFLERWEQMKLRGRPARSQKGRRRRSRSRRRSRVSACGRTARNCRASGRATSFAAFATPAASIRPPSGPSRSANTLRGVAGEGR